jgi:hypothetical protein
MKLHNYFFANCITGKAAPVQTSRCDALFAAISHGLPLRAPARGYVPFPALRGKGRCCFFLWVLYAAPALRMPSCNLSRVMGAPTNIILNMHLFFHEKIFIKMKNSIKMIIALMMIFCAGTGVRAQVSCDECHDYVTLTGELEGSRMLFADTSYLLVNCYVVKSGATLTIQPGTRIFGDAVTKGMLIVDTGGVLIADGQPNPLVAPDPIIFTSCREQEDRYPGDWGGITVLGRAENNRPSGLIQIDRSCGTFYGGRTTNPVNNENSGIIRYVQIHYAGFELAGNDDVNGLSLISIGSGTVIDHVQVTRSATSGIVFRGGTVDARYTVTYDIIRNDIEASDGYTGKHQFGLSLRLDPSSYDNVNSSQGLWVFNDATGSGNSPITRPVFSNMTFIGPGYCGETPDAAFENAVLFSGNTEARIYNSVLAGWNTGFWIEGSATIENANDDGTLFFSYNTFYNNILTEFDHNPGWTLTGCEFTMSDWINFSGTAAPCAMDGNEALSSGIGYSETICDDFCEDPVEFTISGSEMLEPNYDPDDLQDDFFTQADFRGAIQGDDWTAGWTELCPFEADYCPELLQRSRQQNGSGRLNIAPNPANGTAYALFEAARAGKVQISVLDKVSGQVLRTVSSSVSETGAQRLPVPTAGLQPGVYVVQVTLPDGGLLAGQLFLF